jgi:hypothetical protein
VGDGLATPEYAAARVAAISSTRNSLLIGVAGVAALGTLFVNMWNSCTSMEALKLAAENTKIAERGHLTDRFSKAVEQLGDDSSIVVLGGIYSLQQLMRETASPGEAKVIANVLCAFIRVNRTGVAGRTRSDQVDPALQVLCSTTAAEGLYALDLTGADLQGKTIWEKISERLASMAQIYPTRFS